MISDYLARLTASQNLEELWQMHCQKMAEYGFDRLLYGFTRFKTSTSLGDPQDMLILSNHDTDYTDAYIDEGHFHNAPMVQWSLQNEGACSWSWLQDHLAAGSLTPAEARVVEFNRKMGVRAGYSISFRSVSERSKGAIALTAHREADQSDVDALWKEHGEDLIVMNNVAHLKIMSMPYIVSGRSLTRRQREVLEWVGDGKTTQDIAILLGLTTATVEKHLRLAREALDVETTAQAVLKAAFQNQMFVLEA